MKAAFIAVLIILIIAVACKLTVKKANAAANRGEHADTSDLPTGALYPVAIKSKWGYINNHLSIHITPAYESAADFSEGLAAVSKLDENGSHELYGYINTSGKAITGFIYDRVMPFREGYAVVVKNKLFGFIDSTGKEIIPCKYQEASRFSEGLACVKINDKNGFIDKSGNLVIQPSFSRACWVSDFSEGLAAVYTGDDNPGGFINKKGEWVIPPVYSFISAFSEGLAVVKKELSSRYGFINLRGEMVIPETYADGLSFHEGVATVKISGPADATTFAIIDKSGKQIVKDLPYLFTGIFVEGVAGVQNENHLWGFIDKSGTEVIKPTFAGVSLFHNGLARMETGSLFKGLKTIYINKTGKIVWKE